ncbi:E3 ubiquitin/ISG15 ligase TRIM25 [Dunckerocampus dactyliophorus]|uniref:E3 ubiquitin/ISG15 ligase TRIM25 n=1 Tax=Dunckerocampus dactyliophorus TaxID=161453 RepID=UPI002406552D|nr:E3 ubiquitin/ISG15 ligase TRIM25 [Dunckerocampus dactyliophorus]XP_054621540.1 E3 ubiquitin/ISG15 ligase TRIM25 [Dunckerocampus dactyliophorus]XP_054621541.1 E3 ubiquitin/ISG15 ligase TRIM25 [Dunckerocampus dactyliophorus]XP_054621542.1 E3 ubiquitin/ISG15 ligase TRIM25 [Dunckerocampus dactyliophorus]
MASSHPHQSNVLQEELTCPVCLDVYHDPHLLPCGHNFCKMCLDRLRHEADRSRFRCPECRNSHRCNISFQRNFKLANIADDFRSRRRVSATAADSADKISKERVTWTIPQGSFPCDYCPPPSAATSASADGASGSSGDTQEGAGASGMAVRMCLKCEVCMCQEHVKPHLELPAFREHPLTEPMSDLCKRKCRDHDELYKYYCLDDKVCVCNACTVEGRHLGHTVKTLKNTMKDLKMALDKQMCRVGKKDSVAKRKLQEQKQKERQNKKFMEDSEECLARLRLELEGKVDSFVGRLLECTRTSSETNAPAIHKNISRICQDLERLREVRCSIWGLQQENDPFSFIEAYKTTGRRCSKLLRKNMFYPEYVDMEPELLGVMMEEEMRKFLDEEIPCYIVAAINSICRLSNVEEDDERIHNQEATRETDDDDDDDDDNDDDDDVLDDSSEEEMRSEGEEEEEEDEGHDLSELAEDLYIPEEDDEELEEEEDREEEEEEEDQEEEENQEEEEDYEDDEDGEERRH